MEEEDENMPEDTDIQNDEEMAEKIELELGQDLGDFKLHIN